MRYWNRESPRSRAKLSSIFTAIGTIYRPRSGSNSNAGGWAHRQGPKRFYQGNSRGPRSTREHTLSGSRNLSAHCAATTSEMCQRITMLAHRPGIHRPSLGFQCDFGAVPFSSRLSSTATSDPARSNVGEEEGQARWRINSANVAPKRTSMHSSSAGA